MSIKVEIGIVTIDADDVLGKMTTKEIVECLDTDELLDVIGIERCAEYFNLETK